MSTERKALEDKLATIRTERENAARTVERCNGAEWAYMQLLAEMDAESTETDKKPTNGKLSAVKA